MRVHVFHSIVAFAAAASAILITYPPKGAKVDLSQPLTIKWDAVETDPPTFDLYLVNQAVNPSVTTLIAADVDTNKQSYTISANEAVLVNTNTGGGYQIDFKSSNSGGILAQSPQFKVTGETSESSSASSSDLNLHKIFNADFEVHNVDVVKLLDSNLHHTLLLFCDFIYHDFYNDAQLYEIIVYHSEIYEYVDYYEFYNYFYVYREDHIHYSTY
ncbi:UPF0619 GPI-anchored membrane protein [Penicillium oxalicum]|uniref:Yeast cell wall synthesis Kre9/Knh1-like N-terminal domain-containing protein n=1 Tax=Penicillium oxalicum (strain 114-2 / CGMCC 5302) TaxID=933388 RepID=S8B556_PENO1|nr:UPF0619 GPI-anchored membrane protein [Penicillium oxalicum]EPS33983.1 hypothetical protein PDE_08945 [Penicillium oxalicum 114-2]KAI2794432.1 UPF0619 GPI-anchored membrane protein [Penicillium oxalicum]